MVSSFSPADVMSFQEASKGFGVVEKQRCCWNTMPKKKHRCHAKCSRWKSFVAVNDSDTAIAPSEEYGGDDGGVRVDDCEDVGSRSDAAAVLAVACFSLE